MARITRGKTTACNYSGTLPRNDTKVPAFKALETLPSVIGAPERVENSLSVESFIAMAQSKQLNVFTPMCGKRWTAVADKAVQDVTTQVPNSGHPFGHAGVCSQMSRLAPRVPSHGRVENPDRLPEGHDHRSNFGILVRPEQDYAVATVVAGGLDNGLHLSLIHI